MPTKKENKLNNYYVIAFEKYIDLLNELGAKYYILSDVLKEYVIKTPIDQWREAPIPAIIECFTVIHDLRNFLEDKVNNTPEEEVKLAKENNIKDILIKKEELTRMNVLLLSEEEIEARLEIEHKISLATH